jgi:Mor family transcriptional regulator
MTIAAIAAKYRVSYHRAYEIVRDVDGPRAPSLPRSGLKQRLQADRNAKIAAAYFNGVTIRELAQQYALTFQRIHQIVQRESVGPGRRAPDRRRPRRR